MSVEARLLALVQNYSAQYGAQAFANTQQLVAHLSSQAPDLYGEIRALVAAVNANAAARIAGSPDAVGEAGRVATEIAGAEKLSMGAATVGVAVARSLGQAAPAQPPMPPAPVAGAGGWAGESVVVQPTPAAPAPPLGQGYAPPPAPGYVPPGSMPPPGATPAQPLYQNKFVLGAVVLVAGFLIYQQTRPSPTPTPTNQFRPQSGPQAPGPQGAGPQGQGQQGPGPQGGQAGPQGGGGQAESGAPPMLSPNPQQAPTLAVTRQNDGSSAIYFQLQTPSGPVVGVVAPPSGSWEGASAAIGFATPGDPNSRISSIGNARLQLRREQGATARIGTVQWQQGNGIGPLCVAFVAPGQAQDVPVGGVGTALCIADGACNQAIGCGRIGQ